MVAVTDVPQELIKLLDERAGMLHSRNGTVVTTLAEILTRYNELTVLHHNYLPEHIRGDGPCGDCGTYNNIIWYTDSVFWNAVMRPHGEIEADPLLCVTCFVRRVDACGLAPTGWRLVPDWHWETRDEKISRKARVK